jgi:putative transposase
MSKEKLCGLLGVSRQAHHKSCQNHYKAKVEEEIIVEFVIRLRERQKRIGVRKIFLHIEEELTPQSGIKIGRDALFDLLRDRCLLVKNRKRRPRTTDSNHNFRKYPNLVRCYISTGINQLLVSDITYIDTDEGFVYLFLITDAYSRRITGYYVGITMEAIGAVIALQMAIKIIPDGTPTIHHSDRGVQYASTIYTDILNEREMIISMTEQGNPLENCMAERVNGLIKALIDKPFATKLDAITNIPEIIDIYNKEQKHGSIGMMTPYQAHQSTGPIQNIWKKEPAIASV